MLSLYKLEIFATVVQVGSFSGAAPRLHMTQPAVSQHIRDLERSLGTSLFVRGRRGVTLTAPGETLYHYTQRILTLVTEAESKVTNVEQLEIGQISIGATPGVSVYLLPEWIKSFRNRYPNLHVALQTNVTTRTVHDVLEHKLDVGFVEGELDKIKRKGIGSMVLRPVKMLIVVAAKHPWAVNDNMAILELHEQPFIARQPRSRTRVWMDGILSEHQVRPNIIAEFDNQEAIKQAVMSGMGVSILPDYAVERECRNGTLATLQLEDITLERQLKLIWSQSTPFTPVTRALIGHLLSTFPQLDELVS